MLVVCGFVQYPFSFGLDKMRDELGLVNCTTDVLCCANFFEWNLNKEFFFFNVFSLVVNKEIGVFVQEKKWDPTSWAYLLKGANPDGRDSGLFGISLYMLFGLCVMC